MSITHLCHRLAIRAAEQCFLQRRLKSVYHSNLTAAPSPYDDNVDVVTVAFNNPRVIVLHNAYVKKYLCGHYTHIVVDNSSDKQASAAIRQACEAESVPYVRLHRNRLGTFSGSYSHAAALNWTCRHIIRPRHPYAFGFIDHDLFPVRPFDIKASLQSQPFYGAQRKRGKAWYLSAIMFFFRFDFVADKKLDFMPVTIDGNYLDSGGGNWKTLFSTLDEGTLTFVSERTENYREGNDRHQDLIELFDNGTWVHTINGSYWKKVAVVKEDILDELVGRYEAAANKGC